MMGDFFPNGILHYAIGGLLIGSGVSILFALSGKVGGISTFFSAVFSWFSRRPFFIQERFLASRHWRLAYAGGLVLGAWLCLQIFGDNATFAEVSAASSEISPWRLLVGGLLVGFGARLSNGCTSGHGICGLASLQWPSLLAVMTFLGTAIGVAHLSGS